MCEYCEEGKEVFEDSCITLIADSVGLTVVDYRNNENGHEAVVKINFCPMCGRDLRERVE